MPHRPHENGVLQQGVVVEANEITIRPDFEPWVWNIMDMPHILVPGCSGHPRIPNGSLSKRSSWNLEYY